MGSKKFAGWLFFGAVAALAGGCAHHETLVGAWAGTAKTNNGQTEQYQLAFSPNGSETMTMRVMENGKTLTISAGGNYQVSGSALTQTWKTLQMNGQSFPAGAGMVKAMTYQYALQNNTLTLTRPDSAAPLVLTRQGT